MDFSRLVNPYQAQVEHQIEQQLSSFGAPTKLRSAIEYALKNGGKRLRPTLVYLVAKALGREEFVHDAALAVEFFHTASLIADDLPCMDNERERRQRPTLHRAFDEGIAILACCALIAAGYDRIRLNAASLEDPSIGLLALEQASRNTGILGATGGQYLDLYLTSPSEEAIWEVMEKKTAALFELSFVFGWLFAGGAVEKLNDLREAAYHFGIAFQISDDLLDYQEDLSRPGSTNYAVTVGKEKARSALHEELRLLEMKWKQLQIESQELHALMQMIALRADQAEGAAS